MAEPLQLQQNLANAWAELARAVVDRKHVWHTPTLVSIGLDGAPVARTVVMRCASEEFAEIRCHTDRRSPKIAEIARDDRVSWHFYAPELKLQLRLRARATVHLDDGVADDAWAKASLSSRRCYLAPSAPSTVCAAPSPNLPEHLLKRVPTLEESLPGRANFAVVSTKVEEVDWLWLASEGHQRARFTRFEGRWIGAWIEA